MGKLKTAEVVLEYQPLIPQAPSSQDDLYKRACSNDKGTVDHWQEQWLSNIKFNKARFGSFAEHSAGKFFGANKYMPAIVAGSGPSLKHNAAKLAERDTIPLVSCLHNFHLFEDLGLETDFYVSLDAGEVTVEEVSEGGKHDEEYYWQQTEKRTLIAYIGTHPTLLEKWRGQVYFFNAPVPNQEFMKRLDEIEKFNLFMSNGGNVLGGCLYFAKAILGCASIIFTGADFSFGYPTITDGDVKHKFHSWDSKYDKKMGQTLRVTDIYGNKVHTWPSYYNFKHYFDWFAGNVAGTYINATEGGCLGAYAQGNIAQFKYMDLEDALKEFQAFKQIQEPAENPGVDYRKLLY